MTRSLRTPALTDASVKRIQIVLGRMPLSSDDRSTLRDTHWSLIPRNGHAARAGHMNVLEFVRRAPLAMSLGGAAQSPATHCQNVAS